MAQYFVTDDFFGANGLTLKAGSIIESTHYPQFQDLVQNGELVVFPVASFPPGLDAQELQRRFLAKRASGFVQTENDITSLFLTQFAGGGGGGGEDDLVYAPSDPEAQAPGGSDPDLPFSDMQDIVNLVGVDEFEVVEVRENCPDDFTVLARRQIRFEGAGELQGAITVNSSVVAGSSELLLDFDVDVTGSVTVADSGTPSNVFLDFRRGTPAGGIDGTGVSAGALNNIAVRGGVIAGIIDYDTAALTCLAAEDFGGGVSTSANISVFTVSRWEKGDLNNDVVIASANGVEFGPGFLQCNVGAAATITAPGGARLTMDGYTWATIKASGAVVSPSEDLGLLGSGWDRDQGTGVVPSFTVAELLAMGPTPAGSTAFCSDESGGAVLAFYDGVDWRRSTDRAIVS